MEIFNAQMTQSAADGLEDILVKLQEQIIIDINSLSTNPFPSRSGIKKLKGFKPPLYRLRSGDYRVLYRIQSNTVTIMRAIDRKEPERIIKRLKLKNKMTAGCPTTVVYTFKWD